MIKRRKLTILNFVIYNVYSTRMLYYSAQSEAETDLFVVMGSMYELAFCRKVNICCG